MAGVSLVIIRRKQRTDWPYRFVERRKLDSSEQWIQLCHGNPSAVSNIQAFLHSYAASGTAWRVCLGPEEYRQVHVIRHATTIEDAWAALVKVADHEVMRPKIIEHPSDAALYSLGFSSNQRNRNPHCVGVAKVRCATMAPRPNIANPL
jgi:hypothetical protein